MLQKQINVALGERSYSIITGVDMISSFAPICRQNGIPDSIVIITDKNVGKYHLQPIVKNLTHHYFKTFVIEIPSGEIQKNVSRVNAIITKMLKEKITRNSAIIAFGGGVIGDLAGFVASIYQRGIKLIQVPTTLLSQVDSSIGGKVGINHLLGKNMIGSFYQPVFVWMDSCYLKTLPQREIICGIGEVIKYGIIRDAHLFSFLESNLEKVLNLDTESLTHLIARCASIKAEVVSQDERESGIRVILNMGHTIGHGIESAGDYKLLKHGEAILLGIYAESFIAKEMQLLDNDSFERIISLICRVPIAKNFSAFNISVILDAMGRDKKRVAKKHRFVLPIEIGNTKVFENVNERLIKKALKLIIGKSWNV